jgi:hypothetical protein
MKRVLGIAIVLVLFLFVAPAAHADDLRDRVCFGGTTLVSANEVVRDVVLFGCGARLQTGARVLNDVVAFGSAIAIEEGAHVEKNVVVFGGAIAMEKDARVERDVVVFGGSVRIAGEVVGDVVIFGGGVALEPTAVVGNNVIRIGGVVDKKESAIVRGEIRGGPEVRWNWVLPLSVPFRNGWNWFEGMLGGFLQSLVNTIALVALGALLIVFLPTQLNQVASVAEKSAVPSLGVGCLTWLVVPPLILLFAITCLGIPLSLVLVVAFVAALVLGWIAISVVIGTKLLNVLKVQTIVPLLAMVVGLLVLWLVTSLPLLGALIWLFVTSLALGAVVLTRFGTCAYPLPVPVSSAPPVVVENVPRPSSDEDASI